MKKNSVQRRIKRYKIIYVRKTIEAMVPDNGVCVAAENSRQGRMCRIPRLKPADQMKREQSFQVAGPRLFYLPKKLRT